MSGSDGHGHGRRHRHGHGHRHSHGNVPAAIAGSRSGADEGLRTVILSAVALAVTAGVQLALVGLSGSVALLADALHNLGDVFTTATLWVAFVVGRRPGDRRYTFGLARSEDVAGVLVVLAIAVSALIAGWESLSRLLGDPTELRRPGWALAAALVGVLGNEAVAQYKIGVGRRIRSVPLEADGQHSRVDGLASMAAAAGIVGAWLGWPAADPIAGLVLTVVICWILVGAARDVLGRLLDRVDEDVLDHITGAAAEVPGVVAVHDLRARWVGRELHVLLHAEVDGTLPLVEAHALGERVRHAVFHAMPGIHTVDLHLDPAGADAGHRDTRHHAPASRTPGHAHGDDGEDGSATEAPPAARP
jgi:cation diffusion facilitator family transporter